MKKNAFATCKNLINSKEKFRMDFTQDLTSREKSNDKFTKKTHLVKNATVKRQSSIEVIT